ncbi:hypothetical protein PF004_g14598 [Phytophthora fragariae]|uniref:Uncharacterized protein n=1 Tax=Phytophthora fragariae TaxID=53985 RepID=A0A6G0NNQ7_9STRA|nr:hypothetical protein PF004_g14598 [Phytophthora fragariae]
MEAEAVAAHATIQNLEQKLAASEQSSDLFARQLDNVKESSQAKLMDKDTQLQRQQARFTTKAELWKHEIAALTKAKLELESENDRLHGELSNEVLQRGFAEAKSRTLKTELDRTSEKLQMFLQERERFECTQIELAELLAKMASGLQQYELQRQQLEERANNLFL